MKTINYTGSSKLISRIVNLLNRKAPLPLDGDGDPDWGTNGQFLTTDGAGGTTWSSGGGGGDTVSWTQTQASGTKIAEIDINGTSQNVYVPTAPTVNDGTLTIQQNGTTVGTFSANQSGNTTVNLTGGGGSGGHTIWNRIKSALTQRGKLWFADASVSDVSADDATKVEVVTELQSESAFDNLATDGTADGIYAFPDSGEEYLTSENIDFVVSTINTGVEGLTAYKVGRVAMLDSWNTDYVTASANTAFWNLPASLKPVDVVTFKDVYSNARIFVGTAGTVYSNSSLSNAIIRFTATYITES